MNYFCSIPEAIDHVKQGKLLIVMDRKNRENEGDFFLPADLVTPQSVNFMITHGKGLVCVAITKAYAERLKLLPMVHPQQNTEKTGVNFAISVNAARGIGSGVSAFDRAKTIKLLARATSTASDFTRPGHVFPLIADDRGVLARDGHTEAAVTLSTLAGFRPAGILCEIIRTDGHMAQRLDLEKLCKIFDLKIVSVTEVVSYIKTTTPVVKIASARLPTTYGTFDVSVYQATRDGSEHAVLHVGNTTKKPFMARIHSQCLTGDTFSSLRCDCRQQLHQSMKMIQQKGRGVLMYLHQEGRGIGLANKIKAYALQDQGLDTVEANHALGFPADARTYDVAAAILHDMGIIDIDLLTNNPEKERQLRALGIHIRTCVPLETPPTTINAPYLNAKKLKLGHRLARAG